MIYTWYHRVSRMYAYRAGNMYVRTTYNMCACQPRQEEGRCPLMVGPSDDAAYRLPGYRLIASSIYFEINVPGKMPERCNLFIA